MDRRSATALLRAPGIKAIAATTCLSFGVSVAILLSCADSFVIAGAAFKLLSRRVVAARSNQISPALTYLMARKISSVSLFFSTTPLAPFKIAR